MCENGGEAGLHPSNVHDGEYAIGAINFTWTFPAILAKDGRSRWSERPALTLLPEASEDRSTEGR